MIKDWVENLLWTIRYLPDDIERGIWRKFFAGKARADTRLGRWLKERQIKSFNKAVQWLRDNPAIPLEEE